MCALIGAVETKTIRPKCDRRHAWAQRQTPTTLWDRRAITQRTRRDGWLKWKRAQRFFSPRPLSCARWNLLRRLH